MQVLDDRFAADDIEEADVALAVSHNVEILDDVAVAVKLAVESYQVRRSLCYRG